MRSRAPSNEANNIEVNVSRNLSTVGAACSRFNCLPTDTAHLSATKETNARTSEEKFQVMTEICRKFSRYARQEFHLMIELSS